MAKNKYYAVLQGKKVGIFDTWEETKEQIDGYSGAVYKGFKTIEEARAFLGTDEQISFNLPSDNDQIKVLEGELIAYVDGSFDVSTMTYSYGVVAITSDGIFEFNGIGHNDTAAQMRNVAGELKGSMQAVNYAINNGFKHIIIHHDYEGIAKWAKGLWKANLESTKKYKMYMEGAAKYIKIDFVKVAAHTGVLYNERADILAKEAIRAYLKNNHM